MVIDLSRPVKAYFTDDDLEDFDTFSDAVSEVSQNIELVPFRDCETLLKKLESNTPHILFIDINLGKTTGIECLKVIRTMPQLLTVPKIVMSTSASRLQIDEFNEIGCNYYLQKPSSYNEIISEMKKIFEIDWDCI